MAFIIKYTLYGKGTKLETPVHEIISTGKLQQN